MEENIGIINVKIMPIPKKGKSEKNSAFMKRCVEDKVMRKEFKNIKQRIAVCLSQKTKNKNWIYKH